MVAALEFGLCQSGSERTSFSESTVLLKCSSCEFLGCANVLALDQDHNEADELAKLTKTKLCGIPREPLLVLLAR